MRLFPHLTLALAPVVLVAASAQSPSAAPPSESSRFLVTYRMQIKDLSPLDPACAGAVDARQTPAFLRRIERALSLIAPRIAALGDGDHAAPGVRCAVLHVEALTRCAETIHASLDGSAEKDAGAERPSDPFVAALDRATRDQLATLYRYFAKKTVDAPAHAADFNRLLVAADVAEVMCKGRFAAHIAGAPSNGGELPDDANPWGWCQAVAAKAELAQHIATDMIARGKATLAAAKDDLESRANALRADAEAEAKKVWDEAAGVRAAAEDLAAIHQIVGLPIPDELSSLAAKARSRSSAVLDKVLAKIPGLRPRESDKTAAAAPSSDDQACEWQTPP